MNYEIIDKAKNFAIQAHASINHKRKSTDEPYHVHLEKVAYLVSLVITDESMIAGAWLHDVLEDVAPINDQFSKEAIQNQFGEDILYLVMQLTDVSKERGGNRETRKALDRERLSIADSRVKTIKLADIIDNTLNITQYDKNFSIVYLKEIKRLLPSLEEGNAILYKIAGDLVK